MMAELKHVGAGDRSQQPLITPHDSLLLPVLCGENLIPHQGHGRNGML